MIHLTRRFVAAGLALGALAALFAAVPQSADAQTLTKVRVGKSVATSFAFAAIEVGQDAGIWKQVGLDLQMVAFNGDAQMQQALTANSIDFGLGSGPGLGYAAKGVPAKGVAAFAGKPQNMAILVPPDSKIKSVADLKGTKIGVTTAGSLTDWLVRELARQQGWAPEAIEAVPMGAMRTRLAAMKTGDIQGTVQTTANGYELEEQGEAKVLMVFGELVPNFHTHVIFAHNDLIKNKPDVVKQFLQGWFRTVKYMKENKDFTVKSVARTMKISEGVIAKTYEAEMDMMSDDGVFDPKAIEVIRRSFTELGILDFTPKVEELYTTQFVPVKF